MFFFRFGLNIRFWEISPRLFHVFSTSSLKVGRPGIDTAFHPKVFNYPPPNFQVNRSKKIYNLEVNRRHFVLNVTFYHFILWQRKIYINSANFSFYQDHTSFLSINIRFCSGEKYLRSTNLPANLRTLLSYCFYERKIKKNHTLFTVRSDTWIY